jgi:hypothetical protein
MQLDSIKQVGRFLIYFVSIIFTIGVGWYFAAPSPARLVAIIEFDQLIAYEGGGSHLPLSLEWGRSDSLLRNPAVPIEVPRLRMTKIQFKNVGGQAFDSEEKIDGPLTVKLKDEKSKILEVMRSQNLGDKANRPYTKIDHIDSENKFDLTMNFLNQGESVSFVIFHSQDSSGIEVAGRIRGQQTVPVKLAPPVSFDKADAVNTLLAMCALVTAVILGGVLQTLRNWLLEESELWQMVMIFRLLYVPFASVTLSFMVLISLLGPPTIVDAVPITAGFILALFVTTVGWGYVVRRHWLPVIAQLVSKLNLNEHIRD